MIEAEPVLAVVGDRIMWQFPDGVTVPWVRGGEGPEDGALATLEAGAKDLAARITELEVKEHGEREKADELLEKYKNDGVTLANATQDQFEELDGAYTEPDRMRDELTGLRKRRTRALELIVAHGGRAVDNNGGAGNGPGREHDNGLAPRRWSRAFAQGPAMERLRSSGVLSHERARVETDPSEILTRDQSRDMLRQRTTVDISTGGALVPVDQRVFPPVEKPVRRVRLLDMITIGTTDSDIVKWTKQSVRTDAATPVAFGTAAGEADYEFSLQTSNVRRIPQFIPATKDTLADQGQLETLLEQQLATGVRLSAEAEVLNGAGTGEHFLGILGTSGIGSIVTRDGSHATEYDLDALHRAITTIRLGLFGEPDGLGLHPTDFETINLQKDSQGRYIYPPGTEIETIWGLVPVVTPLFTAGTALIGDYSWATLWLREGITVSATDGYQDFFTRGMVAILAQMRAAFAVQQPAAFAKVTGL